jgi:hypothetical protein
VPTVHEYLSERFIRWEQRGRGWQVFAEPVSPEPPFRPFYGHDLPIAPSVDDGCRPTLISSFIQLLSRKLASPAPIEPPTQEDEEPEPQVLVRDSLIELQTSLPTDLNVSAESFEQCLLNLSLCREPIAFELLGIPDRVTAQFAVCPRDAPVVRRQLQAYFPEVVFQTRESTLEQTWETCSGEDELVVEFGLAREFMLPIANGKLDPFVGIIGALSELQSGEVALFQVLFEPTREPWPENILRSVTHADGKPFFVNAPELAKAAGNKISKPLYAAVVRIATKAETFDRALQIGSDLASSLRVFAHPQGNELIPLKNDEYPFYDHIEDVLRRQSRRSGMLLNSDELIGFVHLPSSAVRSSALERETGKTKAAPAVVTPAAGILLGNNIHAGRTVEVRLSPEQRVRHSHIIGASGTGKSTLLFNLIRQDIENGEGVAVLDPHGDLVDKVLGMIPPHRIGDVVLVDPSDEQYSVGFNILSAHSDLEKDLLASDLVSVFQRLSTSWGDQMNSVLQNAILAFLESDRRGTVADMRRFLIEPAFRNEFLKSVKDSEVVYYWQKSFPHLSGNKSIGSILTRLDTFLAKKPIRHMVSQPENRLDFAKIMDTGKIFLAKLPEGLLGKENSHLLGTLLVSKFQQMAMSRQAQRITARRDFWLYIDEFANFITPSMAEILSGARKYRIGLTLAHHELHQLQRCPEVASAVMSHPFTRIVFRVGDEDARKLSEGFSFFEARDLKNLETGHAIARVERSDFDFNLSIPLSEQLDESETTKRREEVIAASRKEYGTPRTEVEARLREMSEPEPPSPQPTETRQPSPTPKSPPMTAAVPVSLRGPIAEPKAIEVPNETVSEKKMIGSVGLGLPIVANVEQPSVPRESKAPRDLGKGGAQHQAIQRRIKEAAEGLGFRSRIEKQLSENQESVDLLLERGDQKIACEISITTTIDHEVGNVTKCLKAGTLTIAIICLDEGRLGKIAAAVSGSLGAEASTQVSYYLPDAFIAYLKTLPAPVPKDSVTTRQGYKVKLSAPKLTLSEQRQREEIAHRVMAEASRPGR